MSNRSPSPVEALPPMLAEGRCFNGERKVRLGDVNPQGRLRFDALTRYTQDVSDDDTTAAGLPDDPGWVVRSTVVDQLVAASLGEHLGFATFCSGLGKRWAERRLSITGDRGAHYEVATLWVCIDPASGQPHTLTEQFIELYGEAAGGRKVSARLRNPRLGDQDPKGLTVEAWPLRTADYDVFGHVNNAAYWAAVEQWTSEQVMAAPLRARLEYGAGLAPAPAVPTARLTGSPGLELWWLDRPVHQDEDGGDAGTEPPDGEDVGQHQRWSDAIDLQQASTLASVSLQPLPADLYRTR